jgi:hypothetical protein
MISRLFALEFVFSCIGLLFAAGCASSGATSAPTPVEQPMMARTQPQQQTAAAKPSDVAPPKDAQWTLFCATIAGEDHVARATQLKNELVAATQLKSWHVVHEETQSTLYYGYYRSFKDPKDTRETQRLQADQKAVQVMRDKLGNFPFRDAIPVPLAAPDPTAPPEWNLVNAKGYWSLQIAAYQGSPERKKAAVDAVRDARAQGVEAYYYHGPNISSVCVGAWPEEALRKQDWDGSSEKPHNIDPNQPIIVLGSGAEKLASQAKTVNDPSTGRRMNATVVSQEVEVADPTLLAAMRQYPTHNVNGEEDAISITDPKTGKLIRQPKPSMIVPIPHADVSYLRPAPVAQPNLLDPGTSQSGAGRLRSIGQ